jgi:hypothetical protein
VLYLLLILLVTFLVLGALLWGGTQLAQGALYEEPPSELYWRAPAAAAAVTLLYGVWCLANYRAAEPGQTDVAYNGLFNLTSEKIAEQPVRELWTVKGKHKIHYRLRHLAGTPPRYEYRDDDNRLWQATREKDLDAIVIQENQTEVRFKPDPAKGRYVEEGGGRYMTEEALGRLTTPRPGGTFLAVLLNLLHLVVWFVALWLLLRFQWPHALAMAGVLWLVMTFVVPTLFDKVPKKAPPAPQSVALATPAGLSGR